jgi:HEAT repeat protein
VKALVEMRTSVAGSPLLKALTDEQRDVRVAAAKGLAALRYSPGAVELEKHIMGKELQKRDLTEQLAFFEAYAEAAGPKGIKLLSRLLNGRRFLWMKHPSPVRACAARALGIIGGKDADMELNVAEMDRDPMVLSAVHKARTPEEEKKAEMPDAGS